jgi:hypothetical protein
MKVAAALLAARHRWALFFEMPLINCFLLFGGAHMTSELNDTRNPTLNRDLWPEYPVHGGTNPRCLQIFRASNSLISE